MLLTGEVKDKGYEETPRQSEALYAHSSDMYLKSDAQSGKHYYDLNAANKSYSGPWLFGKENVECFVGRLKAQWVQWCPVPADVRDGVPMRGNVIYENPNGTSRVSTDMFEGELRTEGGRRFFVGRTQHTFSGSNLPNGSMKVVADLNIHLDKKMAYNPLMIPQTETTAQAPANRPRYTQPLSYAPSPEFQQNYQPAAYRPTQYQQPAYAEPPYEQSSYGQPAAQSPYSPNQGYRQPERYPEPGQYQQQPSEQPQQYQQQRQYRQPEQYPQQAPNNGESGIHF